MRAKDLPPFDALGRDLLVIHPVRRAASLVMPFVLAIAFFVLAAHSRWAEAIVSAMLLTFLTYGSISHDLVHRTLRLPPAVNEGFLCAIELLSLRSGHAYRLVHLHHHAQFPATDDLEGAAAGMTWWRALLDASRSSRGCGPSRFDEAAGIVFGSGGKPLLSLWCLSPRLWRPGGRSLRRSLRRSWSPGAGCFHS
jgi:hypothetical protein